jgi:hypothetical protein
MVVRFRLQVHPHRWSKDFCSLRTIIRNVLGVGKTSVPVGRPESPPDLAPLNLTHLTEQWNNINVDVNELYGLSPCCGQQAAPVFPFPAEPREKVLFSILTSFWLKNGE